MVRGCVRGAQSLGQSALDVIAALWREVGGLTWCEVAAALSMLATMTPRLPGTDSAHADVRRNRGGMAHDSAESIR
jgi:hypothetical protein